MNVLLIEDEQPAAERLRRLVLGLLPDAQVAGVVPSVRLGKAWLGSHPLPDLILSDIRLTDGLSFELLRELPRPVPIIFCTAYDEYALQAFRHNGYDYLLKPIEEEALRAALERVRQRQAASAEVAPGLDRLTELLHAFQPERSYRSRFLVQMRDELRTVNATDVAYFYLENKITHLMCRDTTKLIVDEPLDALEAALDPRRFFRLTRQHLVSTAAIGKMQRHFDGRLTVQLRPGNQEVLVSRLTVPAFKQWLNS